MGICENIFVFLCGYELDEADGSWCCVTAAWWPWCHGLWRYLAMVQFLLCATGWKELSVPPPISRVSQGCRALWGSGCLSHCLSGPKNILIQSQSEKETCASCSCAFKHTVTVMLAELSRCLPGCMVWFSMVAWKKTSLCSIYWDFIDLQKCLGN